MKKHKFILLVILVVFIFGGCFQILKKKDKVDTLNDQIFLEVAVHHYDKVENITNAYLIASIITLPKDVDLNKVKCKISGYDDIGTVNTKLTQNKTLTKDYLHQKVLIKKDDKVIIKYKVVQTNVPLEDLDIDIKAHITYEGYNFQKNTGIIAEI